MSRKRWIWMGAGAVGALLIAFLGVKISDGLTYVNIATGYTAQQTCACLHVSNRTLDSCKSDYPAATIQHITFDTTGDRVRVSVMGGAFKAEADYDATYGCRLVN